MGKRKNVILIMTDDQGYGDFACTGNPWLETPVLDSLYLEGVCLECFHTDPLCAPTRGALMSGRYSFGAGVYSTLTGRYYLKPELKTMADYFREGGYATGMFGKWHLGDTYPYHPHQRGFDVAHSFGGGVIGEIPDYWGNDYYDDMYTVNGVPTKFQGYCTDNWFGSAISFIEDQIEAGNPFFTYLPTNAPHGPFNVDPIYYEKYLKKGVPEKRARFYGMIESIDDNLGKLVEFLKAKGIYEETVIVFFGDNGSATGCEVDGDGHVIQGYNAGMRGKKGHTYEGAHRNLCILTSPGHVLGKPRKVYGLTTHFDLLATFIDLCDLPKGHQYEDLDGISMYEALASGSQHLNEGRTLIVHNMQRDMPQKFKDYTVLRDRMRLVRPMTAETNPFAHGNFGSPVKLAPELYDLANDPSEKEDIYQDNVRLANELVLYYEDWYDARVDYAVQYSPIYIRAKHEEKLTCHAWHDCYDMCFNQYHARKGINANGFWAIKVVDPGDYEIELRRWPSELDLGIREGCESIPADEARLAAQPEGVAYDVKEASVMVLNQKLVKPVGLEDKFVRFKVTLEEGDYNLRTRFTLEDLRSIGAYYVYVRPLIKNL